MLLNNKKIITFLGQTKSNILPYIKILFFITMRIDHPSTRRKPGTRHHLLSLLSINNCKDIPTSILVDLKKDASLQLHKFKLVKDNF